MSEWLASLRTTNGIWLSPPVSLRTRWAMYRPDTAVVGTVHEADTAQLPQSISPVAAVSCQAGGLGLRQRRGRQHVRDHLARAVALVVAETQDVDVVRRRPEC